MSATDVVNATNVMNAANVVTFHSPLLRFVEGTNYSSAQYNDISSSYTYAELYFVLTDFQPNLNNQAIPVEEKPTIIKTALYKPVKISFANGVWKGHTNAIPVGTIVDVIDEQTRLVAKAVVWKYDYPDIYDAIKANQSDVYFSWELLYTTAEVRNDVQWLYGCELVGSTIVDNPAYGDRTPLLSIASRQGEFMHEQPEKVVAEETKPTEVKQTDQPVPEQVEQLETKDILEPDVVHLPKEEFEKLQQQLAELKAFYDTTLYKQELSARYLRLSEFFDLKLMQSAEAQVDKMIMSFSDEQFSFVLHLLKMHTSIAETLRSTDTTFTATTTATTDAFDTATVSNKITVPDPSVLTRRDPKTELIQYLKSLT